MKKVAVIGGGVFGATAAIYAARAGHETHLYEELGDILQAASAINQYRLHRGYHYPRSPQTADSAAKAESSFREEYGEAILDGGDHLYAIAKEKSLVSGQEFLAFCDAQGLPYQSVPVEGLVNPEMVELMIRVQESRFDPNLLREAVRRKLHESGVQLHTNTRFGAGEVSEYDKIISAAYAGSSSVLQEIAGIAPMHQYEVCEKPVVTLPSSFGQTDLVIMDGPFMCIDPIGTSGQYVLGNVVHAIHATNIGTAPSVPEHLRQYLNRGVVDASLVSKFAAFIESGSAYIPLLTEAAYVGSLFTVRTVLPHLDATDARPTMVSTLDDTVITIFSGKIGNCVMAAREAVSLIDG